MRKVDNLEKIMREGNGRGRGDSYKNGNSGYYFVASRPPKGAPTCSDSDLVVIQIRLSV